jgi:hypothetical protein
MGCDHYAVCSHQQDEHILLKIHAMRGSLAGQLSVRIHSAFLVLCARVHKTSKWNKIEHRLFSFISSNWRGEPLRDYETIVNLIAETTTAKGLSVTCRLDRRKYPIGRKVTDEEMKKVNIFRDKFHGEWNYVIKPHSRAQSR